MSAQTIQQQFEAWFGQHAVQNPVLVRAIDSLSPQGQEEVMTLYAALYIGWAQSAASPVLRCAFCDEVYPAGTPPTQHEALTAHVKVCEKHPLAAELATLRSTILDLTADRDSWTQQADDRVSDVLAQAKRADQAERDLASAKALLGRIRDTMPRMALGCADVNWTAIKNDIDSILPAEGTK